MRLIGLIGGTILLLWIMVTAAARFAVHDALNAQWPAGLGTIREAPKRYPVHGTTEKAKFLGQIAGVVGVQLGGHGEEIPVNPLSKEMEKQFVDYNYAQLSKPDDSIDPPPAELEAFLIQRRSAIAGIVNVLNATVTRVDWREDVYADDPPSPNLIGYASLARIIAADALLRARAGDSTAWNDVRAIQALAWPMWRRGETWSVTIATSDCRLANGVARKLAAPLPEWWREADEFDGHRPVIAAQQARTWSWWHWTETHWRTNRVLAVIFSAYLDASRANFLNRSRGSAEELVATRNCAVDADALNHRHELARWSVVRRFGPGTNGADQQRARAYDFERDATAHVFAIKEHRPFVAASRCSDGTWSYTNGVLQFSTAISLKAPGKPAVPRTMRY